MAWTAEQILDKINASHHPLIRQAKVCRVILPANPDTVSLFEVHVVSTYSAGSGKPYEVLFIPRLTGINRDLGSVEIKTISVSYQIDDEVQTND